mgnify:CR=1 FL=1
MKKKKKSSAGWPLARKLIALAGLDKQHLTAARKFLSGITDPQKAMVANGRSSPPLNMLVKKFKDGGADNCVAEAAKAATRVDEHTSIDLLYEVNELIQRRSIGEVRQALDVLENMERLTHGRSRQTAMV